MAEKQVVEKPLTMKTLLAKIEQQSKSIELLQEMVKKEKKAAGPLMAPSAEKKVSVKPKSYTPQEIEKMRLRDRELTAGTFRFHEVKGGHMKFTTHFWKGDPVETWLLVDGCRYALPRGLAKHLRDTGKYISYPGSTDLHNPIKRGKEILNRYSFERDDFDEVEDINSLPRGYAPKNSR